MTRTKRLSTRGIALAPSLFAVAASWAYTDTLLHATGDYPVCTGCHSSKRAADPRQSG